MSILSNLFKRHQPSPEEWAVALDNHLRLGAFYLEQVFNPAATAHIAVDLQKGYCAPCLPLENLTEDSRRYHHHAAATLDNISAFSAELDHSKISQYWLRHTVDFTKDGFSKGIQNYCSSAHDAKLATFIENARDLCFCGNTDKIIDKHFRSGFNGTSLEDRLHTENITTVLISGGMRRACVHETATDAAAKNFRTFIVDDLTLCHPHQFTAQDRVIDADALADYNVYHVTSAQVRSLLLKP